MYLYFENSQELAQIKSEIKDREDMISEKQVRMYKIIVMYSVSPYTYMYINSYIYVHKMTNNIIYFCITFKLISVIIMCTVRVFLVFTLVYSSTANKINNTLIHCLKRQVAR